MKKHSYTDKEIFEGIIKQNNDVFLFIYQQNFRSVKKFIQENSCSEKDAEDLFQDVIVLLFNKIKDDAFSLTCSFNTYLFSIIKNQWLRTLKQRKQRNTSFEECDNFLNNEPEIFEELLQVERKNLFIRHFNELPEECRKIIKLWLKGCSLDELKEFMGYNSVQHTKNKKLACKKTLIGKIINNPRFNELTNEKN
jgi:RNA polymerase sigma factor (sigma-70 family)